MGKGFPNRNIDCEDLATRPKNELLERLNKNSVWELHYEDLKCINKIRGVKCEDLQSRGLH